MTVSVWILGDQLVEKHPAILEAERHVSRRNIVVLMVESQAQTQRLAYHAKKIVLLFSAMRHYAAELRQAGFKVDYRLANDISTAITAHLKEYESSTFFLMQSSSFRGREFQGRLRKTGGIDVVVVPNSQFLTGEFNPLPDLRPGQNVRQEQFYRKMRQHHGVLLDSTTQPMGGKWNFDQQNRQPLPNQVSLPRNIQFSPDEITFKVIEEVNRNHSIIGSTTGFDLAVTRQQAHQAVDDFLIHRLPNFGTYEDGMLQEESILFHSKLAQYLNIGLIKPLPLARSVEQCYLSGRVKINNAEGFIRQVMGWREYMYWQYHRLMPGLTEENYWGANNPLPRLFWIKGGTKLNCLDRVIDRVLETGYTHHIERLMVLSNFCLLVGIAPQEVYEWFSSAFIDATIG